MMLLSRRISCGPVTNQQTLAPKVVKVASVESIMLKVEKEN
jgi:hypothetical protein